MLSTAKLSCDQPDFRISTLHGDSVFHVRRQCLENSEAFAGMVSCCQPTPVELKENDYCIDASDLETTLTLDESEQSLISLISLLSNPPAPPAYCSEEKRYHPFMRSNVIPFPVLQPLLALADKYALVDPIVYSLYDHMHAHAPMYPLQVYAFAVHHGCPTMANSASQFLLDPPLSHYSAEDISIIPTVQAYHALVRLHGVRTEGMKRHVLQAELYPHGYGVCSRHEQKSILAWEEAGRTLVGRMEAAIDVAAEMKSPDWIQSCHTCTKAWNAAVALLAYKCLKLPKRIDQLPPASRRNA
jgi:hypothetical protein